MRLTSVLVTVAGAEVWGGVLIEEGVGALNSSASELFVSAEGGKLSLRPGEEWVAISAPRVAVGVCSANWVGEVVEDRRIDKGSGGLFKAFSGAGVLSVGWSSDAAIHAT